VDVQGALSFNDYWTVDPVRALKVAEMRKNIPYNMFKH
jgi:hypothetical protein